LSEKQDYSVEGRLNCRPIKMVARFLETGRGAVRAAPLPLGVANQQEE
jgi:hypothetical protein